MGNVQLYELALASGWYNDRMKCRAVAIWLSSSQWRPPCCPKRGAILRLEGFRQDKVKLKRRWVYETGQCERPQAPRVKSFHFPKCNTDKMSPQWTRAFVSQLNYTHTQRIQLAPSWVSGIQTAIGWWMKWPRNVLIQWVSQPNQRRQ